MKANLGCGLAYIPGWTNVDASEDVTADLHLDANQFVALHGHETTELYMGHFIEHLMPADAVELLTAVVAALPPGAEVSAVVPDIRQVMHAYEAGEIGNHELNEWYIYSYIQPSHHLWCYDEPSLAELFRGVGFEDVVAIEPSTWPPVWHKDGLGARFQSGVRGTVPTRRGGEAGVDGQPGRPAVVVPGADADADAMTASETLTPGNESPEERVNRLVRMVGVEAYLRYSAEAHRAAAEAHGSALEQELAETRAQIDAIRRSRSFRLACRARSVARVLAPEGSARAQSARAVVRRVGALTRQTGTRG